jgi:hypothetical protein
MAVDALRFVSMFAILFAFTLSYLLVVGRAR